MNSNGVNHQSLTFYERRSFIKTRHTAGNQVESPSNHFKNFPPASKGEETTRSSFAFAGALCQVMAIDILAQRVNAKLTFDPASKQITNHKFANEFLAGAPPRKKWEQFFKL